MGSERTLLIAFAVEDGVREFIAHATNNQVRPPSPAPSTSPDNTLRPTDAAPPLPLQNRQTLNKQTRLGESSDFSRIKNPFRTTTFHVDTYKALLKVGKQSLPCGELWFQISI